jgi:hypothetical protein
VREKWGIMDRQLTEGKNENIQCKLNQKYNFYIKLSRRGKLTTAY